MLPILRSKLASLAMQIAVLAGIEIQQIVSVVPIQATMQVEVLVYLVISPVALVLVQVKLSVQVAPAMESYLMESVSI